MVSAFVSDDMFDVPSGFFGGWHRNVVNQFRKFYDIRSETGIGKKKNENKFLLMVGS